MLTLPKPDQYGSYYLERKGFNPGTVHGPAIFPSKRIKGEEVVRLGTYIVYLDKPEGFLFEGTELKQFATAQEALTAVNRLRQR